MLYTSMSFLIFSACVVCDVHAAETTQKFENPISATSVDELLQDVLYAVQGIVATLAVLMIVIGGVMYITSAGGAQTELAKKTVTAALIGLALALAAPTFLYEIYDILGSTSNPAPSGTKTLSEIALATLKVLTNIIGVLSVLMLVVGGVMYMTSAGSDRAETARKIITSAIIGLIISILSLVIVNAIIGIF